MKSKKIDIELTDAEFCQIARMAHERDITFNKMIEVILWSYINANKKKIPTLTEEIK
jgi:hypothetical protein